MFMVLDSVHHGNKFIKPDKTGIKVPVEESYETRRASSSFDLKPNDTRIETFPHSDHKIVHTIIKKKKKFCHGPGYWKLNSSLHRDQNFIKVINEHIDNTLMNTKMKRQLLPWIHLNRA